MKWNLLTLCDPTDYSPWNSPGQNTGVGSLSLLQGIFTIQESNPGLPHCKRILDQLSHKGSPQKLEWVAYPFSSRSSQPRNQTGGLLHCRWILYQLSYEGSPRSVQVLNNGHMHVYVCECAVTSGWLFMTLWTVARQALPSVGFSREEYWNGLPCPLPWDLPSPGTEPASLTSPALAGKFFTTTATWEIQWSYIQEQ